MAIVDEAGRFVANFSASEVRGIDHKNFSSLLKPVLEFLSEIKKEEVVRVPVPVTCTLDTPLETLILKIGTYRVHRAWIGLSLPFFLLWWQFWLTSHIVFAAVDEKGAPVGVVSLTDINKLFLPNDKL